MLAEEHVLQRYGVDWARQRRFEPRTHFEHRVVICPPLGVGNHRSALRVRRRDRLALRTGGASHSMRFVDGELQRPDGTTIAFDVVGDGPPLVLLHGLTSSRRSWDPVSDRLAGTFTCVRIDLRGHGGSSPAADYGVPAMVGDVHAVVESLGLERPAVVGSSLGASVAAVVAGVAGVGEVGEVGEVRAVVCVDQGLRFSDVARGLAPYADRLRGPGCMEAVVAIEHGLGLAPYSAIEELERRVLAFPPEVVVGVWDTLLTTSTEQLDAMAEAVMGAIDAPLLALHGGPPPADYASWLHRVVPGATLEVWPGTGHLLPLVAPDRFADRVVDVVRAA